MAEHKVGRPPMFESHEKMQELIDKYFEDCEGKPLLDEDGEPRLDKYGNEIYIGKKPPTITGLALALGFNSRLSLLNYQEKDEFINTVLRAKARVEEYAESRLFDRDGALGAKFSLANNFKAWSEKSEVGLSGGLDNTTTDLTNMDPAERKKRIQELLSKSDMNNMQSDT